MFNQEYFKVLPQGKSLAKEKNFQKVKVWLGKDNFFAK
jgi:hypothetical protein